MGADGEALCQALVLDQEKDHFFGRGGEGEWQDTIRQRGRLWMKKMTFIEGSQIEINNFYKVKEGVVLL